jgi:hypothetical protein
MDTDDVGLALIVGGAAMICCALILMLPRLVETEFDGAGRHRGNRERLDAGAQGARRALRLILQLVEHLFDVGEPQPLSWSLKLPQCMELASRDLVTFDLVRLGMIGPHVWPLA